VRREEDFRVVCLYGTPHCSYSLNNFCVDPYPFFHNTRPRHIEPKHLSPNLVRVTDVHRQSAIRIFTPCVRVQYAWDVYPLAYTLSQKMVGGFPENWGLFEL